MDRKQTSPVSGGQEGCGRVTSRAFGLLMTSGSTATLPCRRHHTRCKLIILSPRIMSRRVNLALERRNRPATVTACRTHARTGAQLALKQGIIFAQVTLGRSWRDEEKE